MKQTFVVSIEMSSESKSDRLSEEYIQDLVFNRVNHEILSCEDFDTKLEVKVIELTTTT